MRYLKINEYEKLLYELPEDLDGGIGELFWQNTKFTSRSGRILGLHTGYLNQAPYFVRRFFFPFKIYEGISSLPLDILPPPPLSIGEALRRRRSPTKGEDVIIPFRVLSTILHYSYGIVGKRRHRIKSHFGKEIELTQYLRPIPSAGGLYPLEIYVVSLRVEKLKPAIYHYNVFDSRLEMIFGPLPLASMEGRLERRLIGVRPTTWLVCFFITAIPKRQEIKYLSRAYRYILQESGHLAQNISLIANAYEYGILPIGGFDEENYAEEFGFDFPDEFIVYPLLLAKPSS